MKEQHFVKVYSTPASLHGGGGALPLADQDGGITSLAKSGLVDGQISRSARQHIAPMWSMDMGLHSMCERVQNEYVRSFGCVGLGTEQRYGIKSKRAAGGCGTRQVREYTSAVGALGSSGTNTKTSVRTETAGLRLIHFLSGFWRKHFGMVTRRTIYRRKKMDQGKLPHHMHSFSQHGQREDTILAHRTIAVRLT